jgi:hypothetical protein
MARAVFHLASAGLIAAVCASAAYTPITDLSQLPNGAFSGYALAVQGGSGGALHLSSDSPIFGNVAIGSTSQIVQSAGDTIHGNLDFAGSSPAQGTSGGVTVTGHTNFNVAAADNAVADAESLFSTYTATSSLASLATALGGGSTLTVSGTGNYSAHEFVYFASTSLGAITINAPSSDYVIINVGEGSNRSAGTGNYAIAGVTLAGGITSDHVLFDIDTTGNFQAGPNSPIVNADIIDNEGNTNLNSITLNGRLFCTDVAAAGNCSVVSNAVLNQPSNVSTTPEPASLWLAAGGMLLLALGALRRQLTASR